MSTSPSSFVTVKPPALGSTPDAGAAWVWFVFRVEAKKKVTLEHFLAEPHPSPPTAAVWTSFLLGLRAGGVGGSVGALHLPPVCPHSFKVKSQTEFSPFTPNPQPQGSEAGEPAGCCEVCRGACAQQKCGPVLQRLISIDLFWRPLWVCRQEGRGLRAGVVARKGEPPGRGGQAFGAWAGLCMSAPWTVGSCSVRLTEEGGHPAARLGSRNPSGGKQHAGAGFPLRESAKMDFSRLLSPFYRRETWGGETSGRSCRPPGHSEPVGDLGP